MIKITMNVMLLVVAMAAIFLLRAEGREFLVGDELGWTIPPGGATDYTSWAAKYSFVTGDFIVFDFAVGEQDLVLVTKQNFHKCNTKDPLFLRKDPVKIKFGGSGMYYFTSSLPGHCKKGQKVAVRVRDSSTMSSTSSTSPSPSVTEAPQALPLEFLPV